MPAINTLDNIWQEFLLDHCYDDLHQVDVALSQVSLNNVIYPVPELIFNALRLTSLANTKVVILGQDPYHGDGEANGLAFAVNAGIKVPPSLKNIYKELSLEYANPMDVDGTHLVKWAQQGVLLLNNSLTVVKDRPNSLSNIGWEDITSKVIQHISNTCSGVVFLLWGANARSKARLIDRARHYILEAPHPSPLSVYRGFYGCNHFKLANEYLQNLGKSPIEWLT